MYIKLPWIKTRKAGFGVRVGRNKLSRYPGYQVGIHVNGGPRHDYFLWELVIIYWTVTFSGSWALTKEEYYRRKESGDGMPAQ